MLNCVYHLNDKIDGHECDVVSMIDEYNDYGEPWIVIFHVIGKEMIVELWWWNSYA